MNTNQWSTLLLSEKKYNIKIATLNNMIAFIGGDYYYFDYSKKIETLNTSTNTWAYQYMNFGLNAESVITVDNYVYSGGGADDGDSPIAGIFRFKL
jgi:hypothetical protein